MDKHINRNPNDLKIPDGLTCGDCQLFEGCKKLINANEKWTYCDHYPMEFEKNTMSKLERYVRRYKLFQDLAGRTNNDQLNILISKFEKDSILNNYLNVYEDYKSGSLSFLVDLVITCSDIIDTNMNILKKIYGERK